MARTKASNSQDSRKSQPLDDAYHIPPDVDSLGSEMDSEDGEMLGHQGEVHQRYSPLEGKVFSETLSRAAAERERREETSRASPPPEYHTHANVKGFCKICGENVGGVMSDNNTNNRGGRGGNFSTNQSSRKLDSGDGSTEVRKQSASVTKPKAKPTGKIAPMAMDSDRDTECYAEIPSFTKKKQDVMKKNMDLMPFNSQQIARQDSAGQMLMIKRDRHSEVFRLNCFSYTESLLRKLLWNLSLAIVKLPLLFLALPLVAAMLCYVGVILQKDTLHVHSPFSSFHKGNSKLANEGHLTPNSGSGRRLDNIFNTSNFRYDGINPVSPADFSVLVKATGWEDDVFREELMDRYLALRQNIEDIGVPRETKILRYPTLCRYADRISCEVDPVFIIMNAERSFSLTYPEVYDANQNMTFYLGRTFGGVDVNSAGVMESAQAIRMQFKLQEAPMEDPTIVDEWDKKFRDTIRQEKEVLQLSLTYWSYSAFIEEVDGLFGRLFLFLSASVGIVIVVTMSYFIIGNSITSKVWAGLCAGVMAVLAVVSGYGLMVGVWEEMLVGVYPVLFPLAGTSAYFALDWMQAWRKYSDTSISPRERFRFVMSMDSPSALIFFITASLAMGLPYLTTEVPVLQYGCLQAVASLLLACAFLFSLFATVLYVTGRREMAGLKWYSCFGSVSNRFTGTLLHRFRKREARDLQRKLYDDERTPTRNLGGLIGAKGLRYVALLLFVVYLIFAVWGCTTLEVALKPQSFLQPHSSVRNYLSDYDKYYAGTDDYLELVFDGPMNYFHPEVRAAIRGMLQWVEEQSYDRKIESWLRDFGDFEKNSIYYISQDTFVPVLRMVFLQDPVYQMHASDVVLDPYHEEIVASRMYIQLNTRGKRDINTVVRQLLEFARITHLPLTIRSPSVFLLEHDIEMEYGSILMICVFVGVVGVMSLFLLAQPFVSVLLVVLLGSTAVGTFGLAAFWDVPLNALNLLSVLTGLILSTAVYMSAMYHFMNNDYTKGRERMQYMFHSAFGPALWACLVTALSCLPLLVGDCEMVYHTMKLTILQAGLTMVHCFLFLPPGLMLLTINVPRCCAALSEMCNGTCRGCCGPDEGSSSIYFIPTTACPVVDSDRVQQFYMNKFREDIASSIHQGTIRSRGQHKAICPPPAVPPHGIGTGTRRKMHHATANGPREEETPDVLRPMMHVGTARSRQGRRSAGNPAPLAPERKSSEGAPMNRGNSMMSIYSVEEQQQPHRSAAHSRERGHIRDHNSRGTGGRGETYRGRGIGNQNSENDNRPPTAGRARSSPAADRRHLSSDRRRNKAPPPPQEPVGESSGYDDEESIYIVDESGGSGSYRRQRPSPPALRARNRAREKERERGRGRVVEERPDHRRASSRPDMQGNRLSNKVSYGQWTGREEEGVGGDGATYDGRMGGSYASYATDWEYPSATAHGGRPGYAGAGGIPTSFVGRPQIMTDRLPYQHPAGYSGQSRRPAWKSGAVY